MRAGQLRHLVTVQSRSTTPDTYGEPAQTWSSLYADQPASIEPLSGRELLNAQAIQSDVTHRLRMRYVSGVETKHRILFGSRVFDIRAVRNVDERGIELEILCTEGASAG
jgi:SPP1 family predicted phage head-tail adaptor